MLPTTPDRVNSAHAAADQDRIRQAVREGYAAIAERGGWTAPAEGSASACCGTSSAAGGAGGCCGPTTLTSDDIARAVGYADDELAALPQGANLGLSCGNPTALASLAPGEVVLDLGSGGGFDAFIAGRKVGPTGRVIGVDMTPAMISKARGNLTAYRDASGLDNVEFRLGEIEHLPVADSSVDVVISNCVLNLSPDKPQVWREISRVLKPGGRVAISDLALRRPLPADVAKDVEALVGCIAGASLVSDVGRFARDAGLTEVRLNEKSDYITSMVNADDPLYAKVLAKLPTGTTAADFVTSLEVTAGKAAACCADGCCA